MNNHGYKILMLGWEFSPILAGGLGVVCKDLTTHLVKGHNAEVTYILPRIPESMSFSHQGIKFANARIDEIDVNDIRFKSIPVSSKLSSPYLTSELYQDFIAETTVKTIKQGSDNKKAMYGVNLAQEVELYAQKVGEIAAQQDYEIIHNHDWMTAPAAIKAKELSGKPLVMHVHSTEYERTLGHPNSYIFAQELQGLRQADRIIAVSELTRQKIVANYGIEPDKVVVVHNAIDVIESKYGPISKSIYKDDQIVLFLARLTAMKGANYLLQAAAKVLKVLPKTKFLFVGDGELLEDLVDMSVDLGIAHKVTFTGFLPHDQVDRVYRFADVFVMPSVTEPFGVTPLEAIKNGTPVIISKQSGVSEVLQNVLKVDFWDTDEMANKLIAVLKYGVLADELSNNSKHDLERIDWNTQSKKVLAIYSELKDKCQFDLF